MVIINVIASIATVILVAVFTLIQRFLYNLANDRLQNTSQVPGMRYEWSGRTPQQRNKKSKTKIQTHEAVRHMHTTTTVSTSNTPGQNTSEISVLYPVVHPPQVKQLLACVCRVARAIPLERSLLATPPTRWPPVRLDSQDRL